MPKLLTIAVLALIAFASIGARAEDKPEPVGIELPARVATQHSITLDDRRIDYQAVAETLPLTDSKGAAAASIYTITYLVDPAPGQKRPVSFVFNGGPGAASVFLHLGAIGPRVIVSPASGAAPSPPVQLVDNPSTWLGFTDLVFIDPVGTGFSRGKGKEENPDKPFWDVRTDLASLGATIRLWLTRHQRWDSPVFLVGESYGGFRAAALAGSLSRDVGVTVSGLVMISPALDLSVLHQDERDLLAAAVELPSYAAAAAALAGHPVEIESVERFALSDYLVGLAGLKGLPAPGDAFMARLAALVGLPEDVVDRNRGRIPRQAFAREIRRPEGEVVSIYDATVTRSAPANAGADHAGDPVLDPAIAAFTAAFNLYAPEALGYRTDLPYRVLPRDVSRQWYWEGADQDDGGLGLAMSSLEAALLEHPATKVLIANGRYDLVTPYLGSRWLVDQLQIPAAVRAGIRLRVYDGGHMMYMRPDSRAALAHDAAELFAPGNDPPPQ